MMFSHIIKYACILGLATANVAQVHDYIKNENCKHNYIALHKPACVTIEESKCYPYGSGVNGCIDIEKW